MLALWKDKIAVTRYPVGDYVNGIYVDGVPTEIEIKKCSVQATTAERERLVNDGGAGLTGLIAIYTKEPLYTFIQNNTLTRSDRVTWNGSAYEVFDTSNWNKGLKRTEHYHTIARRIEETDEGTDC